MTPLELEILFWYRCCREDYRQGDFSAPAVHKAINTFHDSLGLLELMPRDETDWSDGRTYRLTERANVFLDYICALPLPVPKWEMPQ